MAIRVIYSITSGELPIVVSLVGSSEPDNIHYSYGDYSFECVPEGNYDLQIEDNAGCIEVSAIELCTDCPEGYTPVGSNCVQYLIEDPTYYAPLYTIVRKTGDASYGVYGAVLFSSWNYNGTGTYTRFNLSNPYWINQYTKTQGPLNRTCVWGSTTQDNQDIGFSFCITVTEEKTYYVGFGCDNYGKIKLNGTMVLEQNISALYAMFLANGHPIGNGDPNRIPFRYWFIYPLTLTAGQNVIEVFGHNVSSVAGVGIQIYDATPYDLENATSDEDLGAKILFDSVSLVGDNLQYEYSSGGGYHGYVCSEGFALDACGAEALCVQKNVLPYCGEVPTTTTSTTSESEQAALVACLDNNLIFETTISDFTPVAVRPFSERYGVDEDDDYIFFLMTDNETQDYYYFRLLRYAKVGGTISSVKVSTANNYYGDIHKNPSIFVSSSGSILVSIETLPGNSNHNGPIQIFRWADPSDLNTYTSTIIGNNSTERLAYPMMYELSGDIILLLRRYDGTPPYQVYYKSSDDGQNFGAMFQWLDYADSSWWMYYHFVGNSFPCNNQVIIGIRPLDNNFGAAAIKYLALLRTDFTNFYKLDGTDLGTTVTRAEIESANVFGTIVEDNNIYNPSYSKIFDDECWTIFRLGISSGGVATFTHWQIVKTNIYTGVSVGGALIAESPIINWSQIYQICGTKYIKVIYSGDVNYYRINNDLSMTLIYTEVSSINGYHVHSNTNEINIDYNDSTKQIRVWRFDTPEQPICITTTTTTTIEPPVTTTTTTTAVLSTLKINLISIWEFDETSGTTAEDAYAANDGTVVNAVVNQLGKLNKCYSFDGTGDYVDFNARLLGGFPFSFSAWINGTNLAANYHVFASNREITNYCGMSILATNSTIHVQYGDNAGAGAGNRLTHIYNTTLNNNTWYHLVLTAANRTSSGTKVYINGSEVSFTSSTGSATTTSFAAGESRIGQTMVVSTANMWAGLIDQTALWGKVLTQTEITALYNSGNGLPYTSW